MKYITLEILQNAVDSLDAQEFTSHELIARLTEPNGGNPEAYIRELWDLHERWNSENRKGDVFQEVHRQIGEALGKLRTIEKNTPPEVTTPNFRNKPTLNANWRKINSV